MRRNDEWTLVQSFPNLKPSITSGSPGLAAFSVHLSIGLAASGVAGTAALVWGLASPGETLVYLALGTLGALLPDLDADGSAPVRASFTLAAVALAFLAMFFSAGRFPSVAELVLVWIAAFLFARWALFALLTRVTVHRGMLHSVPAAAFFGLAAAAAAHRGLGAPAVAAWTAGAFVTFGYLIHLLLDEAYSINLFGTRARRSLGSAFKLWSRRGPAATAATYLAAASAFLLAPPPGPLLDAVGDSAQRQEAWQRLWPRDGWFRTDPAPAPCAGQRTRAERTTSTCPIGREK